MLFTFKLTASIVDFVLLKLCKCGCLTEGHGSECLNFPANFRCETGELRRKGCGSPTIWLARRSNYVRYWLTEERCVSLNREL